MSLDFDEKWCTQVLISCRHFFHIVRYEPMAHGVNVMEKKRRALGELGVGRLNLLIALKALRSN